MSKNINKKAISTIAALATALTLTACSNSNDNTEENAAEETTVKEDKKKENNVSNNEESNESLDKALQPSASVSDDKDIQNASEVVSSYFNYVFNTPISSEPEEIEKILQGMIDIGGEDTFNSPEPISAMDKLDDNTRKELLSYTEKHIGESNKYINYDNLTDSEKIVMNIITIMFRSTVPSYLSEMNGEGSVDVKVEIDQKLIEEPKDGKIIIPATAIIGNANDYSDNSLVTDNITMVKDGKEWKIDGKAFINTMMKEQEEESLTEAE